MEPLALYAHVVVEHGSAGYTVLGRPEARASLAIKRAQSERDRGRDVGVYRVPLTGDGEPILLRGW